MLELLSHIGNNICNMRGYINRALEAQLQNQLKKTPVVAVLGPRQCGKSTLVKEFLKNNDHVVYLDMEKPSDLRMLDDSEAFFLANDEKMICIDEIQRLPELFPLIRYESDRRNMAGQFLILGSASPELIKQSSESLAGRIAYLELTPFLSNEINNSTYSNQDKRVLWLRGGYPRSFLADNDHDSLEWRWDFIRTYIERDIPGMGINISMIQIRRLWTMLAHNSGQVVNYSKLAESLGISRTTVKHYIDILEQTFVVRCLPPYVSNIKKRLVKSPKVYVRDSGLLHALLEIQDKNSLFGHPVYGASWESFAVENILSSISNRWVASFYRTEKGNEIDLVLEKGQKKICVELKSSTSSKPTRGFWTAIDELTPDQSWIISLGRQKYPLNSEKNVWSGSIGDLVEVLHGQ